MVTLRSISKAYGSRDNRVAALTDVTADFPAGTFTAIMGASGSGKSTLLQCAAGLDRVDSGEVVIAGTTLSSLNENALTRMRREQIGFVFQSFNSCHRSPPGRMWNCRCDWPGIAPGDRRSPARSPN
jgi:putative ABC transport system ATP-binding protein